MSDPRQRRLITQCVELGVPVEDAFALVPLIEEWFDFMFSTDEPTAVVPVDALADLVRRLSAWARLDD